MRALTDGWTDGQTDRRTDGHYQVHYLSRFAVHNKIMELCFKNYLQLIYLFVPISQINVARHVQKA